MTKTLAIAFGFGLLVQPAFADIEEVANDLIGPGYVELAGAAASLADIARNDCSPDALREPYQQVWDIWARLGGFHLGPVETEGRSFAISFWPDPKSSGIRSQQEMIDTNSPAIDDAAAFAHASVAMRGLTGLERLIYPSDLTGDEAVLCRLRQATTADLASTTAAVSDEWPAFAALLLTAGEDGNTLYLSRKEAQQALFTQLLTGIEYLADKRIGRPLGSEEKPRPERAEARLAGRSQRNIALSLAGLRDLALALYPDAPETVAAFDQAIELAEGLDDPVLAGIVTPEGWAKVAALKAAVKAIHPIAQQEIGGGLGVDLGFNSLDGD